MRRINRDPIVAVALLFIWAGFWTASYDIKPPTFGQMAPSLWPRMILIALIFMTLLYLGQSILKPMTQGERRGGIGGWLRYYQNPIWCYATFLAFLLLLPTLGMLIAGILFVFALMIVLGGRCPTDLARHALIALGTVGGMWMIFTYALGVILPRSVFSQYF